MKHTFLEIEKTFKEIDLKNKEDFFLGITTSPKNKLALFLVIKLIAKRVWLYEDEYSSGLNQFVLEISGILEPIYYTSGSLIYPYSPSESSFGFRGANRHDVESYDKNAINHWISGFKFQNKVWALLDDPHLTEKANDENFRKSFCRGLVSDLQHKISSYNFYKKKEANSEIDYSEIFKSI